MKILNYGFMNIKQKLGIQGIQLQQEIPIIHPIVPTLKQKGNSGCLHFTIVLQTKRDICET